MSVELDPLKRDEIAEVIDINDESTEYEIKNRENEKKLAESYNEELDDISGKKTGGLITSGVASLATAGGIVGLIAVGTSSGAFPALIAIVAIAGVVAIASLAYSAYQNKKESEIESKINRHKSKLQKKVKDIDDIQKEKTTEIKENLSVKNERKIQEEFETQKKIYINQAYSQMSRIMSDTEAQSAKMALEEIIEKKRDELMEKFKKNSTFTSAVSHIGISTIREAIKQATSFLNQDPEKYLQAVQAKKKIEAAEKIDTEGFTLNAAYETEDNKRMEHIKKKHIIEGDEKIQKLNIQEEKVNQHINQDNYYRPQPRPINSQTLYSRDTLQEQQER